MQFILRSVRDTSFINVEEDWLLHICIKRKIEANPSWIQK